MARIKIAIILIVLITLGLVGCIEKSVETCDFSQPLYKETSSDVVVNEVTFEECVLANLEDKKPETVFASIKTYINDVIYEDEVGFLTSWVPNRVQNTLTEILPNEVYFVTVNEDCILRILEN